MTPLQYRRWYSFARRMALRTFHNITPARRNKIAKEVRHVLWMMDGDIDSITDWDGSPAYVGDRVSDILNDHYHERFLKNGKVEPRGNLFLNQVECCVRAGLDVASTSSGGVLGWTVEDLRRMYPLGLPKWLAEQFVEPITDATPGNMGVWL